MAACKDHQIGVAKPTFSDSEAWRIPRSHGLVEHACICVKRQQIATVVRPSPRTKKATLLIWPLEGPQSRQVAHSHDILHNEGADEIYIHSIEYLETFEGWAVFQVPAVCHLFSGFDLHPLCTVPIVMHNREIDCTQLCNSRNELVLGCYDSRVVILKLSKETVEEKTDASSLTTHHVLRCSMKKRLSWSVGSGSVWPRVFCLDENLHLQGYRLFAAVVSDLVAYDYETGAQLFRTQCHSKILSMDIRRDTPCICVGNQANELVVYSARGGSLGKVLDTLHGHRAPVSALQIDPASKVCYTLDANSELCGWNVDQHVLLLRQKLVDDVQGTEIQKNNPWRKVELHPASCKLQLATMMGVDLMLIHTHDHQESLMSLKSHLRYLGAFQSTSPIIWMRCIRSRALLDALGWAHEVTVAGVDDNVLLVVSKDGTIQVMHSFSGDILAIITAPNSHEVFLRKKEQTVETQQSSTHEFSHSTSEEQPSKKHGRLQQHMQKNASAAATQESDADAAGQGQAVGGKKVVRGGAKNRLRPDDVKVQKLIEAFKEKSGYTMTSEEIRKKQEEQDAKRAFMKKLRNTRAANVELGDVVHVEYLEDLSESHQSGAGLLMLLWTSGSVDLIDLEKRECVQIFEDHDAQGRPTSVTFFPQKDFPVESLRRSLSAASVQSGKSFKLKRTGSLPKSMKPHFAVVGNSAGMLKVWTPSTVSPPAVTHKFKPITLDPNLDAGAIVGVARIEQVDTTGHKIMGLLTASAKGSICLFRAYTWEPLSLAQVPHIPAGSNAEHDLKMVALYDSNLALLAFNDGELHAWHIKLTTVAKDKPGHSSHLKLKRANTIKKQEADEVEIKGDLSQLWPPAHKEDDHHHFGQGQIIDVMPSENRFTSKSLSTGLLEWYVELRERADSDLLRGDEQDRGKDLRSHSLRLLHGDQFSRMGDLKSRMHGEGELETSAVTSCYVRSADSVLVAVNQEIIALHTCRADMLKPMLEDLHEEMIRAEQGQKTKPGQQREQSEASNLSMLEQNMQKAEEKDPSSEEEPGVKMEKEGSHDSIESMEVKLEATQRRKASKEQQESQDSAAREKAEQCADEARRKESIQKFMERAVGERDASLQAIRDLDLIPTPFTLHFSRGKDDNDILNLQQESVGDSSESSFDDSGSEDMEESIDLRDKPRDLETHLRIRFNAAGLATEGGPIDIKAPLQPALMLSPKAFNEMTEAGLDKSVHHEESPRDHRRRRSKHHEQVSSKEKSKPLHELQEEMSRRGLGEVCSLKPQTSLFGDLSRTFHGEPSSLSESEGYVTRGHSVAHNERSLQSLSFNSMTLDVHSAEQNIEAAHSVSCVDKIFKENGGKACVPFDNARKKRPATALGGLGENSLSRLSLNSLGSQEKGSLRSLSSVWEDGEVFRDVTLRGGFSGGHGDDRDNYGLRQFEHPDPRPSFSPGSILNGSWHRHIAPEMLLSGKRQEPTSRPKSAESNLPVTTSSAHSNSRARPGSGMSFRSDTRPRRHISLELRSASKASCISEGSIDAFTLDEKAHFLDDTDRMTYDRTPGSRESRSRASSAVRSRAGSAVRRTPSLVQKLHTVLELDSMVQATNRTPKHMLLMQKRLSRNQATAKDERRETGMLSPRELALLHALPAKSKRCKRGESPPGRMMEPEFELERYKEPPIRLRFIRNMASGLELLCGSLLSAEAQF